jgi:hypothetical protein
MSRLFVLDQLASPRPVSDAPIGLLSIHFTGRKKEDDFIQDALSKIRNGIPSCCAVHGMPGIGKSQLVLHYAKISFESDRYSYIFWMSAASVDNLNQGFAQVLESVRHPDRYRQEQNAKLTAARLWLEEAPVGWLIVLDNVDRNTFDFLRTHLPRRNARGNILFTTRTADVAEALVIMVGHQDSTLKLRTLERRDAANLLLEDAGITITPSLLSRAEELAECVGRLPLAIVQAASFMKKTHTTLDEMLEFYKSKQKIEVSS